MTECERVLKELESKAIELESAERAARLPGASEKDVSDARMLREDFFGLSRRATDCIGREGTAQDEAALSRVMARLD